MEVLDLSVRPSMTIFEYRNTMCGMCTSSPILSELQCSKIPYLFGYMSPTYMTLSNLLLADTIALHAYVLPVGMFAMCAEREYVICEDFMKAVRKVSDTKKLESKLDYKQI